MSSSIYNGVFNTDEQAAILVNDLHQIGFDLYKKVFDECEEDEETMTDCMEAVKDHFNDTIFKKYTKKILRRYPKHENVLFNTLTRLAKSSTTTSSKHATKKVHFSKKESLYGFFIKKFMIGLSKQDAVKNGSYFSPNSIVDSTIVTQNVTRTILWELVDEFATVEEVVEEPPPPPPPPKRKRKKRSKPKQIQSEEEEGEDEDDGGEKNAVAEEDTDVVKEEREEETAIVDPSDSVSQIFNAKQDNNIEPSINESLTERSLRKFEESLRKTSSVASSSRKTRADRATIL